MKQVTAFYAGKFASETDGTINYKDYPTGTFLRIQRMRSSRPNWYYVREGQAQPINESDVPTELKAWCLLLQ